MKHEVKLEDASNQLKALFAEVAKGGEVVLTQGNQPVAELVCLPKTKAKNHLKAGYAKGIIRYMADDFDAPLDDFKEYM